MDKTLGIGAARMDITPKVMKGLHLAGSGRPCKGVHDPLYVKALVFQKGKARCAIVVSDIVGWLKDFVGELRQELSAKSGLDGRNVMMVTPQIHNSPGLLPKSHGARTVFWTPAQEKWARQVKQTVAATVSRAVANVRPARIGVAVGEARGIGGNRRPIRKDGRVRTWDFSHSQEVVDWGPVDDEVKVLRIEDEAGSPFACAFSYTCHPNTCWAADYLSADYPGHADRVIRAVKGKHMVNVFLNGASGNIDTFKNMRLPEAVWHSPAAFEPGVPVQKTFDEVERYGNILGGEALKLLEQAHAEECADEVMSHSVWVDLPCYDFSDADRAREALEAGKTRLEKLRARKAGKEKILDAELDCRLIEQKLSLYKAGLTEAENPNEVQVIAINRQIAFVGIPADYFVEFGLEIKKKSPFPFTFVAAHANGFCGYLPTREAYRQGGYEPYCLYSKYLPGAGQKIAKSAVSLLRETYRRMLNQVERSIERA